MSQGFYTQDTFLIHVVQPTVSKHKKKLKTMTPTRKNYHLLVSPFLVHQFLKDVEYITKLYSTFTFSALTLLVGWQEGHPIFVLLQHKRQHQMDKMG